jgi:hypothetical protein
MKKKKLNNFFHRSKEEELTDLIEKLLKKFPPLNKKNIIRAFQELVIYFPGIIDYLQFETLYKKNRNKVEISKDILKESKVKKRVKSSYGAGMGGRRGISKEWVNYMKSELIIFYPSAFLKKLKSEMNELRFHSLLKPTHNKYMKSLRSDQEFNWNNIDKPVKFALLMLYSVLDEFYELFDENDPKHRKVLSIMLGKDSDLYEPYFPKLPPTKGKSVTQKNIDKGIADVHAHMMGKSTGKLPEEFYKTKKMFYLTWLAVQIFNILDYHKDAKIYFVFKKIISELDSLPFEDQSYLLVKLAPICNTAIDIKSKENINLSTISLLPQLNKTDT